MYGKLNLLIICTFLMLCAFGLYLIQAFPGFFAYLLTAFGLGLRHGLDADHIVIIDNITRKLKHQNKPSSTTGLFFALGHSTIVFIMTLTVILGLDHASEHFYKLIDFGNNFGTLISILLLGITLILNLIMIQSIRKTDQTLDQQRLSFGYRICKRTIFNIIDKPKKMYLIGLLFGLGFDTATEISLLALAANSLIMGLNFYFILLLPISFACGMIITDTVNSFFMSKIYNQLQKNLQKLKLYNLIILGFASFVTIFVIIFESASYLKEQFAAQLRSLIMVSQLNTYSQIIGSSIVCIFIIIGIVIYSTLLNNKKA